MTTNPYKQKTTPRKLGLVDTSKYDRNKWLDKWVIKPFIGALAIGLCIICFIVYKGNEKALKQHKINKEESYGMDKR